MLSRWPLQRNSPQSISRSMLSIQATSPPILTTTRVIVLWRRLQKASSGLLQKTQPENRGASTSTAIRLLGNAFIACSNGSAREKRLVVKG
ncbi:hypothetical protein JOE11_003928 [Robbsia andropogonis]